MLSQPDNPHNASDRAPFLRRAILLSVASIVLSAGLGATAVVTAFASGSLSSLGFGFDATLDSIASLALVWRFRVESGHPERGHRIETIAETIVGGVLLVLAAYLGYGAIRALVDGQHPEPTFVGSALLVLSLAVLPPLAFAKYATARSLASGALRADSILTALAGLLALISLIGLVLTEAVGLFWADAVGALLVALLLIREGWSSLNAARRTDATA